MRSFVSAKARSVPPSGIRKFFDIIATMDDVISLGVGEPDFTTPLHIRQAGIRSLEEGHTSYSSNAGMIDLREALAKHLDRLYGLRYDPVSELIITVGVSEALADALIATIDPGDEVIVPEPCFVSYKPGVIFAGGTPVSVPTYAANEFQLTAEDLRAAITPRTKALLLGYPNNPTGAVMTRERLLEVATLAEEHDLLVLSDEIYDRLVYGIEHTCFASLPGMRERTVLLGGFSKAYAMTGWRVGYVAAPQDIASAIYKVHQYAIMCAPTVSQYAALEALREGEADVQAMRAEYDRRRRVLVDGLNDMGLTCFEPRGAFYAFPSVAASGLDCEEFSERLLFEEKVAVVPGTAFGACGTGHVRCCYATSLEQIEEALARMRRFAQRWG
ncbi:MAG: aminotransferase class I/II-fold pyridoxal phosphate-dependent enzyme [Chloroflexi bacterium]|nr:aminotransferase class I/II-fold pyridoxal phosphate-dependent enzyme [Chloroflexota bacterium]MBU1752201.1 aminotransferase class I/II-fold pyridoxal phosphate-dependent enzyme [Chloroflexota bacterium]